MSRYLSPVMFTVIGLLVAVIGFAYATDRIRFGTGMFLGILTLALGLVAVTAVKRMVHPPESVEQILYKTEHP